MQTPKCWYSASGEYVCGAFEHFTNYNGMMPGNPAYQLSYLNPPDTCKTTCKSDPNCTKFENDYINGSCYKKTTTPITDTCRINCDSNINCIGFTRNKDTNECWLRKSMTDTPQITPSSTWYSYAYDFKVKEYPANELKGGTNIKTYPLSTKNWEQCKKECDYNQSCIGVTADANSCTLKKQNDGLNWEQPLLSKKANPQSKIAVYEPSDKIMFYSECQYKGNNSTFDEKNPQMPNFTIKSMKIPRGHILNTTLKDAADFTFTSNVPCINNVQKKKGVDHIQPITAIRQKRPM